MQGYIIFVGNYKKLLIIMYKGGYKMRYQLWFDFFDTKEQAEKKKAEILSQSNSYYRKNKKISITNWESQDGKEKKIIMWYYIK